MTEAKLPPLPEPFIGHQGNLTPQQAREYGAACARAERERCAALCRTLVDMKEEMRAERVSREQKGTEGEIDRLRHWAVVSTHNAAIRRCIAAILAQPVPGEPT